MPKLINWCQKWIKLIQVIITRDISSILYLLLFKFKFFWYQWNNKVLVKSFDENVKKFPNKTAIIYHDEHFTFLDVANLANKIANWIEKTLNLGYDEQYEQFHKVSVDTDLNQNLNEQKMNCESNQLAQIGLMFGNILELPSFLIGIARVRCSAVMFNTNHRRDTLINAFKTTNCRAFIFESKYLSVIEEIGDQLPDIPFFIYDRLALKNNNLPHVNNNDYEFADNYLGITRKELIERRATLIDHGSKFAAMLNSQPSVPKLRNYRYQMKDKINYIFTSGTTGGNIKASPMNNIRQFGAYFSHAYAFGVNERDNIYISLPCYHSFAGVTGFSFMFMGGATITMADKFSASKFWSDCCKSKCTVALYIGEICRYLLAQPIKPEEKQHSIRLMIGLGLNKNIWSEFRKRFAINRIGEFYGSTEGNVLIFNRTNVEGSCGFIPYYYGIFTKMLFHIYLIKVDENTMEIVRNKNGLCKFARPGETGMIIGQIRSGFAEFLGYTSTAESKKKIVSNIRRKGDFAFVSGDLVQMDFYGNLYFKDRTGDTFRWKGENVSTTEIETIISQFLQYKDCTVYGVIVPNCEGRAGMMTISDQEIDLEKFYAYMKERTPNYAIPKFIRITERIEQTSTLKYIKHPLQKDGFNPAQITPKDQLFYFDNKCSRYLPLNQNVYDQIVAGNITIS